MSSTADLLRLPPELLLRVSSYLTTVDLGSFRRTCHQVESGLFESFAREFFSRKQFMIEHVSLEALVGIANHKTLAPYVKEVIIGLDFLDPLPVSMIGPPARDVTGQIPQRTFTETGLARDMLVEAFSKLPNLQSVGLRDYSATGRLRDGEDARWRSYGWTTGLSEADKSLHTTARRQVLLNSQAIFPLILFSLGLAGSPVEHVNVFLRAERLCDPSFNVLESYMRPTVAPLLSHLRTLLLSVRNEASGTMTWEPNHDHLKHFLGNTPLLEHLRLNFSYPRDSNNTNSLLSWLGATYDPSKPSDSVELKHLTNFELGLVGVDVDILLRVVTKFQLTSLSLWKVALRGARSATAPSRPGEPIPIQWQAFLEQLSTTIARPLEFESLLIGFPNDLGRASEWVKDAGAVSFAGKVSTDGNGETVYEDLQRQISYRKRFGSNVGPWLKDLAGRTHVPALESESDTPEDGTEDVIDDSDELGSAADGASDSEEND